jgi:hypothetical protein
MIVMALRTDGNRVASGSPTAACNLRFSAIDLVLDPSGDYWFLELNPNGQWAWIEARTGLPISEAITNELVRISNEQNS